MALQFTVRLKNEPGALASLAEALGARGIDIRHIGAGGVGSQGVVVLTTNDDAAARDVLRQAKYTFFEAEALTVAVTDEPGSLARVTRRLADAGVNIAGVLVLRRHQGKAELSFTVDDAGRARRVLAASE
ncbi:MAG TPA: ACT domain-containing protein [Chloroflexota bacterium]|jgi:hypothetical protein|nr:ACT domain-containing protein [Chloroflexota bacterium]